MPIRFPRLHVALLLLLSVVALVALVRTADGADEGSLQRAIEQQKQRERSLGSAAERLGRLERSASRAVVVLEGRLAAVQADLVAAQAKLDRTQDRLDAARRRARRLEVRVREVQDALSDLLRARYMGDPPDRKSVV